MSANRRGARRVLAITLVVALLVIACTSGSGASTSPGGGSSAQPSSSAAGTPAAAKGTVKLAVNPWTGYEADAAVIAYLLEHELGYKVEKKNVAEQIAWQGFETGEIDVILENWGHPDLEKTFIDEKKVAVNVGPNAIVGIIGWYVPAWMIDKYPDMADWNNLNKYADLFKTSESGGKGQFLGADPSFVQYDEALIANLGLNFKVIFSGSEAASITAYQTAVKQEKPLLGYFYDPQWLHAEVKLVQIKLPPYTSGCDADLKKVACDYPPYNLNKIVSTKFADTGGDAFTLIKNWTWTNAFQNEVADDIINKNMTPEEAGKKWVETHPDVWKAWLP